MGVSPRPNCNQINGSTGYNSKINTTVATFTKYCHRIIAGYLPRQVRSEFKFKLRFKFNFKLRVNLRGLTLFLTRKHFHF